MDVGGAKHINTMYTYKAYKYYVYVNVHVLYMPIQLVEVTYVTIGMTLLAYITLVLA